MLSYSVQRKVVSERQGLSCRLRALGNGNRGHRRKCELDTSASPWFSRLALRKDG